MKRTSTTDGPPQLVTIREVLREGSQILRLAGSDTPQLEAEIIASEVLSLSRTQLISQSVVTLSSEAKSKFDSLIQRRAKHEPLAYILGRKDFFGATFRVQHGTLIPRPETEILVDLCIDRIQHNPYAHCLDVGTGSGCIAVSVLASSINCRFDAVDASRSSLTVAGLNALEFGVADRLSLYLGNLFDPLPSETAYDVILSNPPYIPTWQIPELDADVRAWEPIEALDGGSDGLDIIRSIVTESAKWLKSSGVMAIEFGAGQADAVRLICKERGMKIVAFHNDLAGRQRVVEIGR